MKVKHINLVHFESKIKRLDQCRICALVNNVMFFTIDFFYSIHHIKTITDCSVPLLLIGCEV